MVVFSYMGMGPFVIVGSFLHAQEWAHSKSSCNGHYNRTPDLGKCVMQRETWDLANCSILDTKVLDRNIT